MLEIEVHEHADEELKAAAIFYETREAGLGDNFLSRVTEAFESIIAQPSAGTIITGEIRRRLLRQFPYSVYRIETDRIVIIAVAHWSRRPGYWKERK
jgi:plasmid stabilization system protein ParE